MAYRILLFADHKQRDLLPLSILKVYLERELGDDSFALVASYDVWEQVLKGFRPHLVTLNHFHGQRSRQISHWIHNQGGLTTGLVTEGRPNSVGQLKWATQDWDVSLCDLYLAWSKTVQSNLPRGVKSEVVGFPRLPLYRKPLADLIPDREDILTGLGLLIDKPVYTIATSFPSAKFGLRRQEFNNFDWADLSVTSIPGREDPTQWAKDELIYWERFKKWIAKQVMEYDDVQWVLKPHPAEDLSLIRPSCEMFGIQLMLNAPINHLLKISNRHYARVGCTTVCEAWLSDIPTLTLGDEHSLEEGAGKEAEYCHTKEKVDEYLEKWFTVSIPDPLKVASQAMVKLLHEKNPTVRTPTIGEWQACYHSLAQHDKVHKWPKEDSNGQFGKSVTLSHVRETIEKVEEIVYAF